MYFLSMSSFSGILSKWQNCLICLKTPYVSYVSVQASSISLLPTWSSNESCPL